MQAHIDIKNLSKRYHHNAPLVLKAIDLQIFSGERVALIGANGSGKTTLLKLLLHFIIRDSGSIRICGEENLERARRFIGYLPERQSGLENFTPQELLDATARMNQLDLQKSRARSAFLLDFVNLVAEKDFLISDFSKGMVQRVQLAIALLPEPQILLLDEPMSGLDPDGQQKLREVLLQLQNVTILYASHNLSELETLCTSAVFLQQGSIAYRVSPAEMQEQVLLIEAPLEARELLQSAGNLTSQLLETTKDTVSFRVQGMPENIQRLLAQLHEAGFALRSMQSMGILEAFYQRYSADIRTVSPSNPL